MPQTIYADVLFIINFSMDFLALYITSKFLKIRIKNVSTIISALLGALYSVITVILHFENLFVTVIFGYLMCLIAFGKRKIKGTFYIFVTYIAVNFLLGGGMTAVFSFFNSVIGERLINLYGNVIDVPEKLPVNIFAVGVFVITAFVMMFAKVFSRKGVARRIVAGITLGGNTVAVNLIEDSGNTLCEPISGEPVIFLSEKAIKGIIDDKTLLALKTFNPTEMKNSGYKIRIAAYQTVSGRDMCACIRPDKITVSGKEIRAWITCKSTHAFGDGDGIIPSMIIDE